MNIHLILQKLLWHFESAHHKLSKITVYSRRVHGNPSP